MVKAAAVRTGERSLAPESRRKIRDARYLVGEDRFIVTFDSGKEYSFPRSSLEVDDGSELVHIQVDRRRFFFRVTQVFCIPFKSATQSGAKRPGNPGQSSRGSERSDAGVFLIA
jgi:hypothetical protein